MGNGQEGGWYGDVATVDEVRRQENYSYFQVVLVALGADSLYFTLCTQHGAKVIALAVYWASLPPHRTRNALPPRPILPTLSLSLHPYLGTNPFHLSPVPKSYPPRLEPEVTSQPEVNPRLGSEPPKEAETPGIHFRL